MDFEVSYTLENEQQFWDELEDILSSPCETHELIDNALRSFLSFTTTYSGATDNYLQSEADLTRCSAKLLHSKLFAAQPEYVRRQIVYCLLQEDAPKILYQVASFLLVDGQQHEATFKLMNDEGTFSRLVELVQTRGDAGAELHRLLMNLLYEMSRIQRIRQEELVMIEEDFVVYLLSLTERLSDDASDPYHYPVIRVLLVLNEQYMVAIHAAPASGLKSPPPPPIPQTITNSQHNKTMLPNHIISVLSKQGSSFRTFGENIILLLNRESESSLQLLILKILYLLFTTQATYEYFYTNDLRVLVDVMLRNLLDQPFSARALRHTYLRVLHPLLANTQLHQPENNYKRAEILKVLSTLVGSSNVGARHFGQVDETTKRLGIRCARLPWLDEHGAEVRLSPIATTGPGVGLGAGQGVSVTGGALLPDSARGIGMHSQAADSCLSVVGDSVAAAIARPGEQVPSRRHVEGNGHAEV